MEVLRCVGQHELCSWESVCFYEETPGSDGWHLIVKPELMEEVQSGSLTLIPKVPAKKYVRNILQCSQCKKKVGVESRVGPEKAYYFCFNSKEVVIQANYRQSTWRDARLRFSQIESWTGERIFLGSSLDQHPLRTPERADFTNLDVSSFSRTTPRKYQIELFVKAALENSLIVLPTGTGKTLVAVMVMKLLTKLNRGKLGIFLADRVPLVHQQAKVLEKEGNMFVKVITGENSHLLSKSPTLVKICSEFEVLALTAQVFLNLLLKGFPLIQCCCIVFDEAHHARGHHPYSQILNKMSLCPFQSRPRILGLTASPAAEVGFEATVRKIDDLSQIYCSASLLMVDLWERDLQATLFEAETEYSYFHCTRAERKLQDDLWEYFFYLWSRGSGFGNLKDDISRKPQNCWTSTCRSNLQDLLQNFYSEKERCSSIVRVERMFEILLLIDESTVHGVSSIKNQLMLKAGKSQEEGEAYLLERILALSHADGSSQNASSRVEALLKVVRSAISENAASRILVFVQTRYTARALQHVLERVADIEKLRPSRLVGHSGFDGMSWEEEQKPMLDRFRSGIVQLLIATSVLEEGIDVPSCNVVIRFDGMGSLIGTVQSRGRARLRGSRFVVLLSEEERERVRTVCAMESNMHEAVRRSFSRLSTSDADIINHLVDQVQSVVTPVAEANEGAEERLSQQSFVVKMKFCEKWLTESILKATLRRYAAVLKCDLRCSLVYLSPFEGQDTISTYQSICMNGIPDLLQRSVEEHFLWFHRCSTEISRPVDGDHTGSRNLRLVGFYAGVFKDPSTFVQVYSPDFGSRQFATANFSKRPSSIRWDLQEEFLSIHVPEEGIYLEFTLAAVHGWVLLHHDSDNVSHRLYIPLRQSPQAYSTSSDQRLGADVDDHNIRKGSVVNLMGECLVFELLIQLGGEQEERFYSQLLECFENHGILIYDTAVKDICSPIRSQTLQGDGNAPNPQVVEKEVQSADSLDGKPILPMMQKLLLSAPAREDSTSGPQIQNGLPFSTSYLMECIFSQYVCKLPRTLVPDDFYEVLLGYTQVMQERILQEMIKLIDWFCNPLMLLQQALENLFPCTKGTYPVPKNYIFVRHATITPSRVIFYEPLLMKSCRLLRHFDPENFLRVSFRDENMGFIPGKESGLLNRVRGTFVKGLRVAGSWYRFLGCSSSMLRSHSCWMTSLDPSEVRSWLGNFDEIRIVGKYMARVGMGMSASDETITLEDRVFDKHFILPDVKQGNFYFSDGIGKISSLSLKKVLECLHPKEKYWPDTVTAIQIRVAGYKGVLALDPTISSDDTQCQLRESMRKFCSPHRKLEVLNTSTCHPLYLNRQGIVLLSSLGVQDSAFESLQEKQLQELLELFTEDQSEKAITRNCQTLQLQPLLRAGVNIPTEPFLQHILSAIYFQKVQNLATRSHIFVQDGQLLMGVLDETNSLDYGEIFVQICDMSTNWKPQIITGRCATYRNPCFHPGDVRVLRARDIEKLRHLVNCVVFPAKGPRPHTNEMSGSDLDGDLYTVIWLPELIPTRIYDPMLYDEGLPLNVPEVGDSDMFEFFIKTMESAELGLIANSHLALTDSKLDGALDGNCIELAKLHGKAVDFPKTGEQVVVRKDLIPSTFPDFMEKHKRPSYQSQKVIGRMYRRAKSLFGDDLKRDVNVRVQPDSLLMYEGYVEYSGESKETYKDFRTLLRGLMQCYGVKEEAEIVTGCIVSMHDHLTSEIYQWTQVVKQQFEELVQNYRARFFGSVSTPEQKYRLASAWYVAAYTDDDEEMRCLSFPWVVSDVLAVIKLNKLGQGVWFVKDRADHGQSLEECVHESMRVDFVEQHPCKFASLLERRDLLEKVEMCIGPSFKNASVKMFGSSCNFLFEPTVSDVDLCVKVENQSGNWESQIALLDKVLPCLQQDFPGTYAIKDAVVPILKNESGTLAFDITANDGGLRKSEMVLRYISLYPSLLLALTVLVKWARNIGLIASQSRGPFTPFSIAWLFIQFCLEKGFVLSIDSEEAKRNMNPSSSSYSLLNYAIEEVLDPVPAPQKRFVGGELPGKILLAFFRHYADLSVSSLSGATTLSPLCLPDPLGRAKYPCVDLDSTSYTLFRNRCLQAGHALTRTRNVKALYVLGERHVSLRLSKFQSAVIRGAEDFYAQRLCSLTGGKATVRILSHSKASDKRYPSRNQVLHVDIQGDPAAVQKIEKELQDLNNGHCWLPRSVQAFYVKGATFLLFEGSLSDQDRVGFVRYSGHYHLRHINCHLHVPVLVAQVGGSTWKTHALSRLRASVWRQRQYLLSSESNSPATPVTALIRFGTLYVTNVPFDLGEEQSMGSVSISELEEYIVRGRRNISPEDIAQGGDRRSDQPVEKPGPAATDHSDSETEPEDNADIGVSDHKHSRVSLPRRRKRSGASQSLFPHVYGSLEHLAEILHNKRFTRLPHDSEKYFVTLYTPKEFRVHLNSQLEFVSLSRRPVRWLSGSLIFEKENSKPQISADNLRHVQRPNCMRFYIRTDRGLIEHGALRDRVKQNAVLEFSSSSSGQVIKVGSAFEGKVGYVRQVQKERWLNEGAGLIVKILNVTEWEGWNQGEKSFKSHKSRQEVELHMLDTNRQLRGSEMACEQFIQRFWDSALSFKEIIF